MVSFIKFDHLKKRRRFFLVVHLFAAILRNILHLIAGARTSILRKKLGRAGSPDFRAPGTKINVGKNAAAEYLISK